MKCTIDNMHTVCDMVNDNIIEDRFNEKLDLLSAVEMIINLLEIEPEQK